MEALNSLKFWRKPVRADNAAVDYISSEDYYSGDDSDEDSYFELELNSTKNGGQELVESPRDVFGNGRVFPFDSTLSSTSKPQSPISLLKSAPKFKLFVVGFKKSKAETTGDCTLPSTPVLSRDNSLRSKLLRESFDDSNKKSEKDGRKILKVLKPLYSMASKRFSSDVMKFSETSPMVSPLSSPRRNSGFKNVCKNIRKTKSANSGMMVSGSDDSLLHDGIQGAILHCNRSYNSPAKCRTTYEVNSELMKRSSI